MTADLGGTIVATLEDAGKRHIGFGDPDGYRAYLLHIGGTDALRHYDGSVDYWRQVQVILDNFFSAAARAEISARMVERAALRTRPECLQFVADALAERRLGQLVTEVLWVCAAYGTAAPLAGKPVSRKPV